MIFFTVCVRCSLCKRPFRRYDCVFSDLMAFSSSLFTLLMVFFFSRPSPFCSTWSSLCVWGVASASDQFGLIWWRFLRLGGVFLKFAHFVDGLFTFSCPSPFCPTWFLLFVWGVDSANDQFELIWWRFLRLGGVFLIFAHIADGIFTFSRPSPFCPTWSSLCVWGVASASVQFDAMTWVHLQVVL